MQALLQKIFYIIVYNNDGKGYGHAVGLLYSKENNYPFPGEAVGYINKKRILKTKIIKILQTHAKGQKLSLPYVT